MVLLGPAVWLALYTLLGGECTVLVIVLALATVVGPLWAEYSRRRLAPLLKGLSDQLLSVVGAHDPPEGTTELTDYERAALQGMMGAVRDVEEKAASAEQSGDIKRLCDAHEAYRQAWWTDSPMLTTRRSTVERLSLIGDILTDAVLEPAHAALYGAALRRVAIETREAIDLLLDGEPPPQGAFMWPSTYANGRKSDVAAGAGPESLRTYIATFDKEHD